MTKHKLWAFQKNRLDGKKPLRTQNKSITRRIGKFLHFYSQNVCWSGPMHYFMIHLKCLLLTDMLLTVDPLHYVFVIFFYVWFCSILDMLVKIFFSSLLPKLHILSFRNQVSALFRQGHVTWPTSDTACADPEILSEGVQLWHRFFI